MKRGCQDERTCRYRRGIYCVCRVCWEVVGRTDGILPDPKTANRGSVTETGIDGWPKTNA